MLGGPALTARAALRAGCGLAILAMPEPLLASALAVVPEATGLALPCGRDGELDSSKCAETLDEHLSAAHAIAIGPGLGARLSQQQIVMRLVAGDGAPIVIDADALNALAETERFDLDFRAKAILTPHPGEFSRLAARLSIDADPVTPARRRHAAERLAQRLGAVVVLKGSETVVADGLRSWTAHVGNAALATGGSGDVLCGIVASFVAQFHRAGAGSVLDLFDCARLAVQCHGLAADAWSAKHGSAGLLAHELCDLVPDVLSTMRAK
jgi:NAD(P)H-hydrate epimerase